ncbi:MAG: Hydroxypyruvate reductase [Saprospiraceae bacterium]|jgi:D-3-phosphoglycerate dehydrogenase|nr:Hydroxypyruvate reductase [Saprospiraceae bacterium]
MLLNQRPRIWIAEPDGFCDEAIQLLEAHADVVARPPGDLSLREAFGNCDAMIFRLGFSVRREDLSANQRCRYIATPVTGTDHIDEIACREMGIAVISLRGEREFLSKIPATAEHTFALMLALVRKIVPAIRHVREGRFDRDLFRGTELSGKTLGIIGYGRLGSMVAAYARAFGMRVLANDIDEEREDLSAGLVFCELDTLLPQCDVVSLHIDYNKANHHFADASFFARMKHGAFLINTARGALVDGPALVEALDSGHLGGAALDVVEGEPDVCIDAPLLQYHQRSDLLIITPHIGGNTVESFERTEVFIATKLIKALQHG